MVRHGVRIFLIISAIGFTNLMAQDSLYHNEFSLGDVTLLDGPFKKARDLNITTLLKYTTDRLLYPYRDEAGLSQKGTNFPCWSDLGGHVGGHYLSALSMNYAATGNTDCKTRLDYMVTELKKCQDANGSDATFSGYVGGFPGGKAMWRKVKTGDFSTYDGAWSPWYTLHKMYAGLRDAWVYGGNSTAKTMFLAFCDWALNLCSNLNDSQMQHMLDKEHGGMTEMFADAYQMTNDVKYLNFGKKFSHKWLLDPMATKKDILDNVHANTNIPKVTGFLRIGEVGKDSYYYNAAEFFWNTVTTNRSVVIGGNSQNEYFPIAKDSSIKYIMHSPGMESCNTNNMLKLTEGLFRMKPDAKYADYFERALFNQILSTQHPTHGGYVYFTPANPRHYRVYSAPNMAMWCCVGTGMENHSKYDQFIYTHTNDSLFVNLFIASELNWKEKGVTIRQETQFPDSETTVLKVSTSTPKSFKLLIRHPYWVRQGEMKVIIGTDTVGQDSKPTSYVEVNRTWNGGEVVTVLLPMHFTYESLVNVPNWVAIKRGPIVLGAKTSADVNDMPGLVADDGRFGNYPGGKEYDYNTAPKLKIDLGLETKFVPVAGKSLTYKAPGLFQNKADTNLIFEPFFRIHDARYMMYWNANISTGVDQKIAMEKVSTVSPEIVQSNGVLKFSFDKADPSRHVVIYSLSGRKVANIPAVSQAVTFNYLGKGVRMRNGTYTAQVISGEKRVSKAIIIYDK